MNEKEILLEKLAFLRYEQAKTADAMQKFSITKNIEETEKRLKEVEIEYYQGSLKVSSDLNDTIILFYVTASDQLVNKNKGNFLRFHSEVFSLFGIQTEITKFEFQSLSYQIISQRLFEEAYAAYLEKI